jgi:tryptophan-rich sensory protein
MNPVHLTTQIVPPLSRSRQILGLMLFVAACFAAATMGAVVTSRSVQSWYQRIAKPIWTPPDSIFAPVWTTLYFLMAISAWLVWRKRGLMSLEMGLFFSQLTLNVAWSGIFFGLRQPGLAFAEILLLWLLIALTAWQFMRTSTLACVLFVPYLAWTSFAAALNYAIWGLNS